MTYRILTEKMGNMGWLLRPHSSEPIEFGGPEMAKTYITTHLEEFPVDTQVWIVQIHNAGKIEADVRRKLVM